MLDAQTLGEVLRALNSRGFSARRSRGARRVFEGPLKLSRGTVPVRLVVEDWEFLDYPRIQLLDRPSFLPELLPHATADGDFCYLRPESLVLDRFNPVGAILLCIAEARDVLDGLVRNPAKQAKDIQDEFLAYWAINQRWTWKLLVGTVDDGASQAPVFRLKRDEQQLRVASTSSDEVRALASSIGYPTVEDSSSYFRILRSTVYPAAPAKNLPATVKELFAYFKTWDPALNRELQVFLEHDKDYLGFKGLMLAIETPAGWLGVSFKFDELVRQGYRRKPAHFKNWLHNAGGRTEITRIVVEDVSPKFVHSRNLMFRDLTDKKITLVGCGAIGGFLAKALSGMGAGRGRRGALMLHDPGTIGPENVGRHYLGMNSWGLPKAEAMADDLRRQFPGIVVESKVGAVSLNQKLLMTDLLIDATGKEAVSEMLNHYRLAANRTVPPFLFVSVRGNGEAVQALWTDDRRYACFRCLRRPPGPHYFQDRFKLLNASPIEGFKGCQAFTPYAVSAPMSAAALATDMVADWLKGNVSPRFRTRAMERADVNQVKNKDLEPIAGCPACQAR